MPETVTTIGGMFVLGCAFWIVDRVAYRRGQHVERAKHEAAQERRLARLSRSIRCAPSPATLTLSGFPDDASAAAFLCRMVSGTDRIIEEGE